MSGAAPSSNGESAHTVFPADTVSPDDTEDAERQIDPDVLRMMLGELRRAEPGSRHLITDEFGKVSGALRQPSTYPEWLDELPATRNRRTVQRIVLLIDTVLEGTAINRKDSDLWTRVRVWAKRNRDRMYAKWGTAPPEQVDALARVSDME